MEKFNTFLAKNKMVIFGVFLGVIVSGSGVYVLTRDSQEIKIKDKNDKNIVLDGDKNEVTEEGNNGGKALKKEDNKREDNKKDVEHSQNVKKQETIKQPSVDNVSTVRTKPNAVKNNNIRNILDSKSFNPEEAPLEVKKNLYRAISGYTGRSEAEITNLVTGTIIRSLGGGKIYYLVTMRGENSIWGYAHVNGADNIEIVAFAREYYPLVEEVEKMKKLGFSNSETNSLLESGRIVNNEEGRIVIRKVRHAISNYYDIEASNVFMTGVRFALKDKRGKANVVIANFGDGGRGSGPVYMVENFKNGEYVVINSGLKVLSEKLGEVTRHLGLRGVGVFPIENSAYLRKLDGKLNNEEKKEYSNLEKILNNIDDYLYRG